MTNEASAKTLKRAARTIAERGPRHRNVLLVESDPDLQWSLARALTVNGNRVIGTSSAEGALTVIEQWPPDLALVASSLSGASGVDVARRLHEQKPELLVVLIGEEPPAPIVRARSTGVTAYLTRPFRFEALRALLDSLQLAPAPAQ
jgi:DNA-binding response OmpR family regulator